MHTAFSLCDLFPQKELRMSNEVEFSIEEFRGSVEELFVFIPYLEERVNGTFKFQYYDYDTETLCDCEGYEENNKIARFEDPVHDETWNSFKRIVCRTIWNKLQKYPHPGKTGKTGSSPAEYFHGLLRNLLHDVVHERLFTGFTASCMQNGRYLQTLLQIKCFLAAIRSDE